MEQIALISDIHGNMPALDATLEDIARRRISRIFCLGDLVGKGPHSDRVVDRCRAVCEVVIRGNWEDGIVTSTDNPTLAWHKQRLGDHRLDYLRTLPNRVEFVMSGRPVRLFHASPRSVHHRVRQRDPEPALLAMFDNTALTGHDLVPDVVGYGDIHEAYVRSFPLKTLFNVGSVGNPHDTPQASYAVLEGVYGGTTGAPLGIQLIRVPYDIERAVRDAIECDMPSLEPYAHELRTAQYRGPAEYAVERERFRRDAGLEPPAE